MSRYADALLWAAYVAVPIHAFARIDGLPLGPIEASALLAIGWIAWRRGRIHGARFVACLLALKLLASFVLPAQPGFRARYFANEDAREPFEPGTEYPGGAFTRVDRRLEFEPGRTEFPLAFFNDIGRFNFYRPDQPDRRQLPFAVEWTGHWWLSEGDRPHTVYVDAPGASADLTIDGWPAVTASPGGDAPSVTVPLRRGWHRLAIRFASRSGGARRFAAGEVIDGRRVPFDIVVAERTSDWQMKGAAALRPIATALDVVALAFLAALLLLAVGEDVRRLRAGRLAARDALTALFVLVAIGEALAFAAPWAGRLMVLDGGSDPLTYEHHARDILLNGLLMTGREPLGQGGAFYYQPLYPYFLAAAHRMFGEGMFGVLLVERLLVAVLVWALLRISVLIAGAGIWETALACAAIFGYTKVAPLAATLLSESVYIPLLALWTLALLHIIRSPSAGSAALAGVLGGVTALARSTALLAWALVFPACWAAWHGVSRRRLLMGAMVLSSCAIVGLATARNWVVAHKLVIVTSSLPVNLYMGNEPPAGFAIDLTRHDKIYDRLGLETHTRLVVEYALLAPGAVVRNLGRKALYTLGFFESFVTGSGYAPFLVVLWMAGLGGLTLLLAASTAPPAGSWLPALIALTQFAVVVIIFPHVYGDRLILPFYTLLVPYASVAVHRMRGGRLA